MAGHRTGCPCVFADLFRFAYNNDQLLYRFKIHGEEQAVMLADVVAAGIVGMLAACVAAAGVAAANVVY